VSGHPLRVLLVEDSPDDARLLTLELKGGGFAVQARRVDTAEDTSAALAEGGWDLVVADFSMPGFSGVEALDMVRAADADLPFVFVSGTIGEEVAVRAMKLGANDYFMKGNLGRLCPAIARELREAESRRQRRLAEQALLESQKMQAIGQLAGGIAHDFNNILSIILGFGSDVLTSMPRHDPHYESVSQMVSAGERAALLTQQLLAFSRRQIVAPRSLDVNAIVRDMEPMVRRLVGEDIEIVLHLAEGLGSVRADPTQIQQVLINLIVNARDAMPTGGRLVLSTAMAWLDDEFVLRHPGVTAGPHIQIAVTDSGIGIAPEVLPRIFEPFFTTKALGQGTGLGLATVYAIVSAGGGHVRAYSEPGRGTTFKVYLPCVDGVPDDIRRRETGVVPRGTETILVVEDEAGVRELVRRVLESLGYTVVLAADPIKGRERASELGDGFALLLTDVVMPRGSGPELARALSATRPGLRVLYVSGYTTDAVAERGGSGDGAAFLSKPFTAHALAHAVRALLDGPAPASRRSP
jgi:signal transduction histidine kinase